MSTWLPAVLKVVLDWILGRVLFQLRRTGEDAQSNTALTDRLNNELDAWKKGNGVPR